MPVVLTQDGPSLGGFVCPVTITSAQLWQAGQVSPLDAVRFQLQTLGALGTPSCAASPLSRLAGRSARAAHALPSITCVRLLASDRQPCWARLYLSSTADLPCKALHMATCAHLSSDARADEAYREMSTLDAQVAQLQAVALHQAEPSALDKELPQPEVPRMPATKPVLLRTSASADHPGAILRLAGDR